VQVIDYEAHSPVHGYLARRYKDSKFDCVIDAFGIVDIWLHCPDYLTERGLFVNVGIAFQDYTLSRVLYATYLFMLKFPLLPTWLGGVPRRYVTVTGFVNQEGLEKLRALVEEGKLRVVIDSVWDMEDALKVCAFHAICRLIFSVRERDRDLDSESLFNFIV
jgi:NADPH:quinone reductase-like Zn-dependent oxidoreductase